jgi:hypothetical protein
MEMPTQKRKPNLLKKDDNVEDLMKNQMYKFN